jgi:hypothetical protein
VLADACAQRAEAPAVARLVELRLVDIGHGV